MENKWARALCCQGKGPCMWPPKETGPSSSSGQPAAHQKLGVNFHLQYFYVDSGK